MEDFKNMSDYKFGMIAKAFMECGNCNNCEECPCNGIFCNTKIHECLEARKAFLREFEKRLLH